MLRNFVTSSDNVRDTQLPGAIKRIHFKKVFNEIILVRVKFEN